MLLALLYAGKMGKMDGVGLERDQGLVVKRPVDRYP